MLHPVILSGGSGTRLWPLSRTALPKQLLPLLSPNSLLQETAGRLNGLQLAQTIAPPIVVCRNEHRFLVAEQLQLCKIMPSALILEPMGRNTAPAVALAAFSALQKDSDALLLVLPSDHVVRDQIAFHAAIAKAANGARAGFLTALGIAAHAPETGYGYIQRGAEIEAGLYQVARFVEKPDATTAQNFLKSGDYVWNSGMFLFGAQQYLAELEHLAPDVFLACRAAMDKAQRDLDFLRPDAAKFAQSPAISIDYAVMEKTQNAAVVPADLGWNDVGSYAALWLETPKDERQNAQLGQVVLEDCDGCYINTEKQLVAALGVENLIVVATADAILVTTKERAQDVKHVVARLQKEGRAESEIHRKVYRPWGSYEGIERGERFQVKRLIVKPGQQSSMQIHHHRSEHWVVVQGTAQVTLNGQNHLISENQSIYIPVGVAHRIFNPGRIPLHFIEVQSGSYLEEDDIVRIEDDYGR